MTLYAILLDWTAAGEVAIQTLAEGNPMAPEKIRSIELLGHKGDVTWNRGKNALVVKLPAQKPCQFAYVLRIE